MGFCVIFSNDSWKYDFSLLEETKTSGIFQMFILDKDYENSQYLPRCHLKLMLCTLGSFECEMDPNKFASEWTSL